MLYDVQVLNEKGVWDTDTVTGSRYRARERARFLTGRPHVPAVTIIDQRGRKVSLDADA